MRRAVPDAPRPTHSLYTSMEYEGQRSRAIDLPAVAKGATRVRTAMAVLPLLAPLIHHYLVVHSVLWDEIKFPIPT